jgi:hypothetical protein
MMFHMSDVVGLVGVLGRDMVTVSPFASVIGVYSGCCIGVAFGGFLLECMCMNYWVVLSGAGVGLQYMLAS